MINKIIYLLDSKDKKFICHNFFYVGSCILEVLSIGLIVPFVSILLDENFFNQNIFIKIIYQIY